ncbi:MAG TPA: ADP-ribosylglycohydrolase family protein [Thermoleophilaceae bacterium]|nr:ADP-ribosylglycohydrolase family protein [Thermoleophilaceae bacterium]
MRDTAKGALLGAFVGDALGMPYEGKSGDLVPERVEMRDGRAAAGSYTDDTQTMVALAESLLRCGRVEEQDLAAALRAHYDERRGYGSGTKTVLSLWEAGVPVSEAAGRLFQGEGSPRNGAAMRVAPVGVRFFRDEARVVAEARRSALLTHAHAEGVDGAVVQAVAVAAAVAGRDPLAAALAAASTAPVRRRLDELAGMTTARSLDPQVLGAPDGRVAYLAAASVPVAVVVGSRASSVEEALTVAVRCGGDTDTVASMAGAISGARFGAASIPPRWYAALEEGVHGRSHVEALAAALAEAAALSD